MFCTKCGTENLDNAKFCKSCGTPLVQKEAIQSEGMQAGNQQPVGQPAVVRAPKPAREKKPFNKKILVVIAESLVLIGIMVAFYMVGSNMSDPKKAAEKYTKAILSGDYEAAYDCFVEMPDSPFLTKEMYIKSMEHRYADTSIKDCDMLATDVDDDSINMLITYKSDLGVDIDTEQIPMKKAKKKIFFFFPCWEIQPGDIIMSDYKIYTNISANVTFDGIAISQAEVGEDDEMYEYYQNVYQVPFYFSGTHDIEGTADQYNTCTEQTDDYSSMVCFDFELSDEVKDATKQRVTDIMNIIYNAAYSNAPVTGLEQFLTPEALAQVEGYYGYVQESFLPWEPVDLKILSGQGAVEQVELYEQENTTLSYAVDGSGVTQCKYRPYEDAKKRKEDCSSHVYGYVQISFIDGQWWITSITE